LIVISVFGINSIWWLIGLLAVSLMGLGAALPCLDALLTESIDKRQRGTITSVYSSMRFIGVAIGPPVSALLMKISMQTLFYVLAASCALACLLALLTIRPGKRGAAQGA
jgi:ACDE family multidrug resistance protein